MRKILAFGDSNTWGFIPGSYNFAKNTASRYPREKRWSGVMANILGSEYEVIEEGLCSRNAILDDPYNPIMTSGKSYLLPCLLSHYPLDLVIIMLGTNELKTRFNLNPIDVAIGIRQLIGLIRSLGVGAIDPSPEILIICPPTTMEGVGDFQDHFIGSTDKSKELPKHYKEICQIENCHFLDANQFVTSSIIDGIHLDSEEHQSLGQGVAKIVREMFK